MAVFVVDFDVVSVVMPSIGAHSSTRMPPSPTSAMSEVSVFSERPDERTVTSSDEISP